MADVSIDSTAAAGTHSGHRNCVFVSQSIGYFFYFDSTSTFVYSKTTNGGSSWGAPVTIATAVTHLAFAVWFDKWTPGDSGTLIHTWFFNTTDDDVFWRSLDTSTDTLGTRQTVFNGASATVTSATPFVSGTKTTSGYLYCAYDIDAGAEKGFHRSLDGGATWSANLATTFIEATLDMAMLFPAMGTGDGNDCWCLYNDVSADAITLKLWDSSAGSAVESATIATYIENATNATTRWGFNGSIRNSDGHLIMACVNDRDTATSDHVVYDITDTSTFSALTSITTDIDDHYYPNVFINQYNNDIYVVYNGKRDGSEVLDTTTKVYYTKSTDGGVNWSAGDTVYMEDAAAAVVQVYVPLTGDRLYAGWRIGTTLLGGYTNSLTFSGGPPPSSTYTDTLPFLGAG